MLHLIHQGGNPGRGFASGLASSLTASTVQNLGGGKIATVIGGSLSGGVGASVVGGDFYQGAVFGLISSSLNHVAHEVKYGGNQKNQPDPIKAKQLEWLAGEMMAGRITPDQYTNAWYLVEMGAMDMISHVLYNYKTDIVLTVFPVAKVVGEASKASTSLGAGRTGVKQWLQGADNLERGTLIQNIESAGFKRMSPTTSAVSVFERGDMRSD